MNRMLKNKWVLAVLAMVLALPAMASAQVHDYRNGRYDRGDRYDRRDKHDHKGDIRVGIGFGSPAYERRIDRVWIEPVYRTEIDRVWIEPVYRTEIERIWIEPIYEMREVVRYEYGRRVIRHERVLVRPGCWETRPRQVLVCEGYWKTVERQVLVRAGCWEERVVMVPAPRPSFTFGFDYRR